VIYLCVRGIKFAYVSTIALLYFRTVVGYFVFFVFLLSSAVFKNGRESRNEDLSGSGISHLSRFKISCMWPLVCSQQLLNYLIFQSCGIERTR
jgi:hypothetical protein